VERANLPRLHTPAGSVEERGVTGPEPRGEGLMHAGPHSHWYRVRRAVDGLPSGLAVTTVIVYPGSGVLSLHWGSGSMSRLSGAEAWAVAACLGEAVRRSLPRVGSAGLVLEADRGQGWFRV
jgi:hypothetical protein